MSRRFASASNSTHHQLKKACRYDVFISFRGSNTRKNFTDHLLKQLNQNGYHPFHDNMLKRGEYIDSELFRCIEESRMSIILFSKNYADSKWCLDELVTIMNCHKQFRHVVLPVFLDVEPSDVRNQEGLFGQALVKNKHQKHRVETWRKALQDAGRLSGLHLQNDANGYEAKLVEKIIEEVATHLKQPCLNVAYHPVGIESRMTKLIQLLQIDTDDVRIVAIWGGGGLGKTTIAKATYNCIFSEFESSSFLEDVKDSEKTTLQNKLLVDLMTDKTPRINNVYRATEEIKRVLKLQRVLLVLDDIDHFEQLEMLAITHRYFCPGSRIIITTRDKASVGSLKMDAVYSPEALNDFESMKLFSLYAFEKDHPHKGYAQLTKEAVQYAGGIPLVLKTIGSSSSKLSKTEWQDNLKKLKKVPNYDVQGKLKVSYDSLGYEEKEIFLDIACFFIGMEKDLMVSVMENFDCFPEIGIKVLVDRSLVNIDSGVLSMHNIIRDMGREIVRQESLKEPGERSRLWDHDDISKVFKECSGTSVVESIIYDNPNNFIALEDMNIKAFEKMKNIRMLLIHYVRLYGKYVMVHSFEKLKFLQWYGFPMDYVPSWLNMRNVVVMDMQSSRLKILWEGTMSLEKLRFLNLSDSRLLTVTPDFSGMKNLEKLLFARCSKLVELHRSITCLDKLRILDLSYCVRLKRAPNLVCILKLTSLKELYIYHCPELEKNKQTSDMQSASRSLMTNLSLVQCNLAHVPDIIGRLESLVTLELHENEFSRLPALKNLIHLKKLTLSDCARLKSIPDLPQNIVMIIAVNCIMLEALPSNMSELCGLDELRLSDCKKLGFEDSHCLMKLTGLGSLSFLKMDSCNVGHVPNEIENLVSLKFLNLGGNKFSSLPVSIRHLNHLLEFDLSDCIELQEVPVLPRNLTSFKATNCKSLINIPSNMRELKSLRELHLDGCSKLGDKDPLYFTKLQGLSNLVCLNMKNCNLSYIPDEIEDLVSLSRLDLSGNIFSSLPDSFCNLLNLKEIELNHCVWLTSFPILPPDFTVLKADYCRLLEMLPFKPFYLHDSGQELSFSHCLEWVGNIYARNFKRYILQFHHELFQHQQVWPIIPEIKVSLTGTEIPNWCTYQGSGHFLSFVVPMNMKRKFSGWIYCAIAPDCRDDECELKCKVVNKTKRRADYIGPTLRGYGPMFLAFVPHLIDMIPCLTFMVEGGDELVLGFELTCENNWEVQECGLCLIFDGDESIMEPNVHKVVEHTPSDSRQYLHQMVYEKEWSGFHDLYQVYINSKTDDDTDTHSRDSYDDDAGIPAGVDHVSRDVGGGESSSRVDDSGSYDQWSYGVVTDGGPWFLLRPEELGDWLHDPMGSQTKFQ